MTRLAYIAKDDTPRNVPIIFTWNGSEIVMCTPKNAPKLRALGENPMVALTIDTEVHPPKILLIRGRAELDFVDGIPDEYLQATSTYEMTPEQRVEWEVEVRSLYDLYPDFDIDVQAEQAALLKADLIVWQCPFYWYGVPALVNLWFEKVLAHGWAYGEGADALSGKTVLWVPTTGGSASNYSETDVHGHPFDAFVPAISQVARFCGMRWAEPPLAVHAAHHLTPEQLREVGRRYRARIESLASESESRG